MAIFEEINQDTVPQPIQQNTRDARTGSASEIRTQDIASQRGEESLRPKTLQDIIGMQKEKDKLKILLESAKIREDVVDHILFYGPPGLGKTTFGNALAAEHGTNFVFTSGPGISSKAELASILTNLQRGDFLFIDEIHRLNKIIEEFLYPVLEDFSMDMTLGKGSLAKVMKLDLPKFTLIGATTQIGLISAPLRDRFGSIFKLDFYSLQDLTSIVLSYAEKFGVGIEAKAAFEVARRSRGTARIAIRNLKRVRDYSLACGEPKISVQTTLLAFIELGIDDFGIDSVMHKYLDAIISNFEGGPVGLSNIAASIYEDARTIEEVYEPYLIKIGFVKRTNQGRVVTKKCMEYVHRE
ncbi:MAG: Holliday junction branch migration DNA helicase RuvB [Candidatus Dojkabacteria bacterium]